MQMVGDLLDGQDLRLMSVLMCGALATVPSQKHIAFITTTLYAAKDWMLRNPKFCEWLLQASRPPQKHQQLPVSKCAGATAPAHASRCSCSACRCSASRRRFGQGGHP